MKTIVIGNLSLGGTGKTPHTEYLAKILSKSQRKIAILSRGYGRKSKGFIELNPNLNFQDVGDEPLQMKLNLGDMTSNFVCENRAAGILEIVKRHFNTQVVLLDDAFQHRAVKYDCNILLSEFQHLFYDDHILPVGNLRDVKSSAKRADIIIITKCPEKIEKQSILDSIKSFSSASVFFSKIIYASKLKHVFNSSLKSWEELNIKNFIVVTGIANSHYFVDEVRTHGEVLKHYDFKDHHEFTIKEMDNICSSILENAIIITTQKDAIRMLQFKSEPKIVNAPIYYLPIEISFDEKEKLLLTKLLDNYVG